MLGRVKTGTCRRVLRMLLFSLGMMALGGYVVGCRAKTGAGYTGDTMMTPKTIQEILEQHTDEWMSIPGVVGTAVGQLEGRPCIQVLAAEKTEEIRRQIPSQVEGFRVVIKESGEIRALESD